MTSSLVSVKESCLFVCVPPHPHPPAPPLSGICSDGHEQLEPRLEILQSFLQHTLQRRPGKGAQGESAIVIIYSGSFKKKWTSFYFFCFHNFAQNKAFELEAHLIKML